MRLNTCLLFPALLLLLNSQAQDIPTVKTGNQEWMALNVDSVIEGSYCFKNDTLKTKKYGRLYDWETALKICPAGFHLPTDKEWTEVTDSLGGINVAGRKLMCEGSSGFNAPLAGNYNRELDIQSFLDKNAYFWTATPFNANVAWFRQMSKNQTNINRSTVDKSYYFSVRCVKDSE